MDIQVLTQYFLQYGAVFIFVIVLLEYLNLPGFPAGVIRMNFIKYSVSSALGIFIWNFFLIGAGYWLGDRAISLFS